MRTRRANFAYLESSWPALCRPVTSCFVAGKTWMAATGAAMTLLVMLAAAAVDFAVAQESFPARAVRLVVPYPAGGGTDILARLLADQLARKWGQSLIVENIGGPAGNIGSPRVARAAPDGHTLLVSAPGPIATNSFLYKDMSYDPGRWVPVALLTTGPYVLAMRKSFEGVTVRDLVARAKVEPGKLTTAIPGVGSVAHLATVQLEMRAGIKLLNVPYRGLAPA